MPANAFPWMSIVTSTSLSRRRLVKAGAAAGLLSSLPVTLSAGTAEAGPGFWPQHAFAEQTITDTMERLFAGHPIRPSEHIEIEMANLAEDGAIVPLRISTTLPEVRSIAILAEKNPVPLIAMYELNPRLEPSISTRIKLAESANVIVVVTAGDGFHSAMRFIEVAIGGCT